MDTPQYVEVQPDVARIVEGLRDTGYDLNSALADIIDNSIAAQATVVDVRVAQDPSHRLYVSIADDGIGMDEDGLKNAMRYGSRQRDDKASLGKFGLGLKTASTAFCRRLVVVSRTGAAESPRRATWDLDDMASKGEWLLEIGSPSSVELSLLDTAASGKSGTLVMWQKVDRVLPKTYKRPQGRHAKKAIEALERSLIRHLAMVFQRFLDSDDTRASNVLIKVNGTTVQPWDPFALDTTMGPAMSYTPTAELPDGSQAQFSVSAYILPRQEEFLSPELRDAARIGNDMQGVFVYRENRLIHGPDWLGMFKSEPHFSLLRVDLSFDHRLDDAFQVDIKKSRILLNEELYDWLRTKFLTGPRREAEDRYRRGQAKTAVEKSSTLHQASDNTIHRKESTLDIATVTNADVESGEIDLKNNLGDTRTTIRIVQTNSTRPVRISTSPTLDSGVLWEAALIDGNHGVNLSTQHPYYRKAYLPHQDNTVVIQALDFLLWSLAQAELNNSNPSNKEMLEDFRIDVSRNLKKLVADLPEPAEEEQ